MDDCIDSFGESTVNPSNNINKGYRNGKFAEKNYDKKTIVTNRVLPLESMKVGLKST